MHQSQTRRLLILSSLSFLLALAFVSFAVPATIVSADENNCTNSNFAGTTWSINYFQPPGTTTSWPFYTHDGNPAQFTGCTNVPSTCPTSGSTCVPAVNTGDTIVIQITVSGAAANTGVWYELDGGNSPWPAPTLICTTDSTGFCKGTTSVTITADEVTAVEQAGDATAPCNTIVQKAALSPDGTTTQPSSSTVDGNNIDHLQLGTTCHGTTTTTTSSHPPPGVPEFQGLPAIGGLAIIFVAMIPLMWLVRRFAPRGLARLTSTGNKNFGK